jgi:hypothetical protein
MVNHMSLPNLRTVALAALICAVSMFTMADDTNVMKMDIARIDA